MPIPLSFLLILLLGSLTLTTDILHQKIKNVHLIVFASMTLAAYIFFGIQGQRVPSLQLWSTLVATAMALTLYAQNIWKGGDAKLFILYAALMPATGYEHTFILPAASLFANSFIAGLIFLTPALLWSTCKNRHTLIQYTLEPATLFYVLKGVITIFCVSWIIFPVLNHFNLTQYKVLTFFIVYTIGTSLYRPIEKLLLNYRFLTPIILLGLFLHFKIDPGFFTWPRPLKYILLIPTYTLLTHILSKTIEYIADAKDRIPFAPFLLLGCLLSYTPFLFWASLVMRNK